MCASRRGRSRSAVAHRDLADAGKLAQVLGLRTTCRTRSRTSASVSRLPGAWPPQIRPTPPPSAILRSFWQASLNCQTGRALAQRSGPTAGDAGAWPAGRDDAHYLLDAERLAEGIRPLIAPAWSDRSLGMLRAAGPTEAVRKRRRDRERHSVPHGGSMRGCIAWIAVRRRLRKDILQFFENPRHSLDHSCRLAQAGDCCNFIGDVHHTQKPLADGS